MMCISLWQPWASLIVIGAKRFETRSWPTSYRGPLLIHAAKHFTRDERDCCQDEPFFSSLVRAGIHCDDDIPLGCILGVADLFECFNVHKGYMRCEYQSLLVSKVTLPPEPERSFGDYSDGRFAWQLKNVRRFPNPIIYTGHQGLFNVDDDVVTAAIERALPCLT